MNAVMTVHGTTEASIAFGESTGLYEILGAKAVTVHEVVEHTGLSTSQVGHWFAVQESAGYVVRETGTGRYRSWCPIG